MNPFLYSTVARPVQAEQGRRPITGALPSVSPPTGRRRRVARSLRALGLAALAWSGGALALDLNTATVAQLQGIRGIGPKTAQIIHQERERGGRYHSFEDLSDRVRGIGPRRAQTLRAAGLTIGAATPAGAAVSASGATESAPARGSARVQSPKR
ncbi:MAG TPA: helix-hairpin-helix domain-containing protein [Castellaniella sp.]|nr:helix-hairpin-helix domain-containing protein [Castellaniella sp.]